MTRRLILVVLLVAVVAPVVSAQPIGPALSADIFSDIGNFLRGIWEGITGGIQNALNWIAEALAWLANAVAQILNAIWNAIQFVIALFRIVIEFFVSVLEIIVILIQVIINLVVKVAQWVWFAFGVLFQAVVNYYAADVKALDGWPQCVSDPTAHTLCAFWYVLDYTLFAPGTPGQIIPDLLKALVAIVITFYVVRIVLRFVEQIRRVFEDAA